MWRLLVVAGCLAGLAHADEHWLQFRSGPFEVFTDAGARAGRETLVRFEEFRHGLGLIVGEADLQSPQPVRILLFRNSREQAPYNGLRGPLVQGRDRYDILLTDRQPISPEVYRAATRMFLAANVARLPAHFERGLVAFFSTIQVSGIRITVGAPPDGAERDLDWARVHLLVTNPEYYGRLRVLLFNLRKGVDELPAYRNAFGKTPAEIEAQTKQHLAAGNWATTELSARPLSVERDFPERALDKEDRQLAFADLLTGDESRRLYADLIQQHAHSAEAHEGLAQLALRAGQRDEARQQFAAAIAAGSQSANCYLTYAGLETDQAKALGALEQAAKLNPKLAEPHFLMAQRLANPGQKVAQLKLAATLEPRNVSYWSALAQAYLDQHVYSEAAKAFRQGEQAAVDPAERTRMRQGWMSIEQQRLDYEAAERRRQQDEQEREVAQLKAQALAHVHELEAQANAGAQATGGAEVVPWSSLQPTGKVTGVLKQVDCLGGQARLVIQDDSGKTIRLLVNKPDAVTLPDGKKALGCGPREPAPRITARYNPKPNSPHGTAGEVATLEFQ